MNHLGSAIAAAAMLLATGTIAQVPPRITPTYADLADLALPAPIAAHVRVREAIPLKGAQAAGVPAGRVRYFVEADVISLIRGPAGLPPRVRYLTDLPNGSDGDAKFRRKAEYLLLASPGSGGAGDLRLATPDAHIPWTPDIGIRIRAFLTEAVAADAPPPITGMGSAFHVPGSLPGESETQLFLNAGSGKPVSLTILRRPGQVPAWSVSLGEIVDEAAATPRRDSLLWYRLACGLPRAVPPASLSGIDARSAAAVRADYAFVLERLGPCERNRR